MQKANEHRLHIETAVVTKRILIQVGLQVVTANVVINATDPALNQTPESFDGVRVNVSDNVDLLAVVDSLMLVAACVKAIVRRIVIGKDHRAWKHMFSDESPQSILLHVGGDERADFALALNHPDDRRLFGAASASTFRSAAEVSFVHLNLAPESSDWSTLVVGQHRANLLEHAPCGFVCDPSLPLNLLCRDTATGSGHEVYSIEPSRERGRGLVKDRVGGGVNVMAAMVARVRRATLDAMMFGGRFARLAKDAIRIKAILQPFQTGGIIRELFLEVFQRVRKHVRLAVVVSHIDYLQPRLAECVPTVKV